MVIVVGNGHGDTIQILNETDSFSHSTNTQRIQLFSLQLWVNSKVDLVLQPTSLGEGKLGIQTC